MSEQAFNFSGEAKLNKTQVAPTGRNLEQMLEENLLLTREVFKQTEKIRRYMLWGQIFSAIKIILIVGPIVVGIFFLQPYFKQIFSTYSQLLGNGTGQTLLNGGGALKGLLGGQTDTTIEDYNQILENNGINLKSR